MPHQLARFGASLAVVLLLTAGEAEARKMRPKPKPRPTPVVKGVPCADAARATALALLKLHSDGDDRASIEGPVLKKRSVRAPRGKGMLDVLAVKGFIYKAEYAIRILYLPGGGCARAGFDLVQVGLGR